MDTDRALVIIRGKNVLEVDKYDYSKHPEAKKLRPSKAASHVPDWQKTEMKGEAAPAAPQVKKPTTRPSSKAKGGKKPPDTPPAAVNKAPAAVTEDVKDRGVEAPTEEPAVQESKIITTTKKSILTKPKAKEE